MLTLYFYINLRYGRRPILIATLLLSGVCGIVKSLSVNYTMFASMEFVTALVAGGTYMTVFIMAIEFAGPTKRVFSGTLISTMYSASQAVTGVVALLVPNFRTFLQILYVPNLLVLTFIWLVPESVRWLMSTGQMERARPIIMRAAKINKIQLSPAALESITASNEFLEQPKIPGDTIDHNQRQPITFMSVLRSRILLTRLTILAFIWFMTKFIYYGMTIQALELSGNKYVNYILVNLVELPAMFISYILMERLGRKWTLCASLLLTGVACVAKEFIPTNEWLVATIVYFFGKYCVTTAFAIIYVYSTELFPTAQRHSTMIVCLTVGSLGSIIAPFTTLLVRRIENPYMHN